MIVALPKNFNYGNQAVIQDGILKIPVGVSWREFTYKLTLATKGKRCWYCKKKLKNNLITMDHLYPKDLGGPTISNNLAPACARCNTDKGNLTEFQYRHLMKAKQAERKTIRLRFLKRNEEYKRRKGFFLPSKWVTTKKIDTVLVSFYMDNNYIGNKYRKIEKFYRDYGKLPYPIVLDRNNYLLDGFLVLMFAKNNKITRVPAIVLENVEVLINKS